nr:hypothetical protein [Mycobacterium gordonae]
MSSRSRWGISKTSPSGWSFVGLARRNSLRRKWYRPSLACSRASAELTYEPLPDGFFMGMVDGEYRPILKATWVAGEGWAALGGVPTISTTPPTATAGTTGKASFSFADPTGTGDPWVISAESTTDDGTTWAAATLDTPGAVVSAGGSTTVKVKSVTAGSTKFRAKVVGTNGASAYTPKSNAVTIT